MSRHVATFAKVLGMCTCARDVGEEPSKWTHFGLKRGIVTDDLLRILAAFHGISGRFRRETEFYRFGADFLTPETRSDPSVITK